MRGLLVPGYKKIGQGGRAAPTAATDPAFARRLERELARPRGLIPLAFSTGDIPASATAAKLRRIVAVSGSSFAGLQIPVVLPHPGFVASLSFASDANKTAGTLDFEVYVDDVATGAKASWANGVSTGVVRFAPDRYAFATDSKVDVRVTSDGSLAPTTLEAEVICFIQALA